jgi:CelD/BcsL family acetyltransferase involved in cellulose biosynthesis
MNHRLLHLTSITELRDSAALWDDLWWRSHATRPTARAEIVAQWIEQFAPQAQFQAWVVEEQGTWLAAIPLIRVVRGHVLGTGALPGNEWSPAGDLLLDADADVNAVMDILTAVLRETPWSLLWFEGIAAGSPPWKALIEAINRAGLPTDFRLRWHVPLIEIGHDWKACQQQWSKKHHCKMLKAAKRLAEQGDLRFVTHGQLSPQEVEPLLRKAFEVEDSSWKGQAGSSVLRAHGMFEFFLRQAEQLAAWDQLELSFLELDGKSLAFVYGFGAKGISYWHKIGYDPEYRCSTPGQLLQYFILEKLHQEPGRQAVDCMGPLTEALSKWQPAAYPVGRLVVAPRRLLGRLALQVYKHKRRKDECGEQRTGDREQGTGDREQGTGVRGQRTED